MTCQGSIVKPVDTRLTQLATILDPSTKFLLDNWNTHPVCMTCKGGTMDKSTVTEIGGDAPMPANFEKPEIMWPVVIEMMGNADTFSKAEDVIARYIKETFRKIVKYDLSSEVTRWISSTTIRIFPKDLANQGPKVIQGAIDNLLQAIKAQMLYCGVFEGVSPKILMTEALGVSLRNIGDSFTITVKAQFGWRVGN
jgi:hypothetical protein